MAFHTYSEVEIICFGCGTIFTRPTHLYNATERKGSNHFCTKSCRSKYVASQQHKTTVEEFWASVDKTPGQGPNGDCWIWTGARDRDGYGLTAYGRDRNIPGRKGSQKSHRISYEVSTGPIPPGLDVMHSCDNPPCCNPAHLSPGTRKDNMGDAVVRDRIPKGERSYATKLTNADVEQILVYSLAGYKKSEVTKILDISYSIVGKVIDGLRWKHITVSNDDPRVVALMAQRFR